MVCRSLPTVPRRRAIGAGSRDSRSESTRRPFLRSAAFCLPATVPRFRCGPRYKCPRCRNTLQHSSAPPASSLGWRPATFGAPLSRAGRAANGKGPVSRPKIRRLEIAIEINSGQKLGDVLQLRHENSRARSAHSGSSSSKSSGYSFRTEPHPAALVMTASKLAARAVQESLNILLGQLAGQIANPRMNVQSAAASLFFRDHHFAAIARQHAHRCVIRAAQKKDWRCIRQRKPRDICAARRAERLCPDAR